MTPDDLWRWVGLTDPRWSPDGRRIAVQRTTMERGADAPTTRVVVVDPADGSASAALGEMPCGAGRWSAAGRLAVIAPGAGDDGVRTPQVWLCADGARGGSARQLTAVPAGVRDLVWSPTAEVVCVVAASGPPPPRADDPVEVRRAPHVVTGLRSRLDGQGWTDANRSHLLLVDAATGEARDLTTGGDGPRGWDDAEPAWHPAGTAVAFVSDRRPERVDERHRGDLWVVDVDGGPPRRLTGSTGVVVAPTWSPDGSAIAHLGNDAGSALWTAELEVRLVVDPSAGGEPVPPTTVARGVHRLRGPEGPPLAWTADGRRVLWTAAVRGRCHLLAAAWPADGGGPTAWLGGDVRVGGFAPSPAGGPEGVVAVASWIDRPPELVVVGPAGERAVLAPSTGLGDAAAATLGAVHELASTAPDGTSCHSYLLVPAGPPPADGWPVAVDLHGGPQGWHPASSSAEWVLHHALLGRGLAVLLPNPRGSSGYGAAHMAACVGDWGRGPLADVEAALDAACADAALHLRPAGPVVHGYSYGGYLASFAIGATDRFRRAVVGAPIADPFATLGSIDIPMFTLHSAGTAPWDDRAGWLDQSPAWRAHAARTPTLLVHNEGDLRCPVAQSELLFTVLRLAGCEVQLVRYPGGWHGTGAPFQVVDRLERTLAWLTG